MVEQPIPVFSNVGSPLGFVFSVKGRTLNLKCYISSILLNFFNFIEPIDGDEGTFIFKSYLLSRLIVTLLTFLLVSF